MYIYLCDYEFNFVSFIYKINNHGNIMFNKLYLVHRKHNDKDIYWTQIGNDSQYSSDYRKKMQLKYTDSEFDTIKDYGFDDERYTKIAQLTVNGVFKEWTNKPDYKNTQIRIDIMQSDMIDIVTDIINHINDDEYIISIMDRLHDRFNPKPKTFLDRLMNLDKGGTIYLMECANDKYKIGMTHNLNRRFNDLKEDERYKAISIIDSFKSEDAAHDEAMLHGLCSKYRRNSNCVINWLQDSLNSELFSKCDEVMEIWNKYKEQHKEYSI